MCRMCLCFVVQSDVNEILLRGRCLRKADEVVREQEQDRIGKRIRV